MSINFLSNANFSFNIKRLPSLEFNVKSVTLPSISANPVIRQTPFVSVPMSADHGEYSPLSITFILDENMDSYKEVYEWWEALVFPDMGSQYKKLSDAKPGQFGLYSDLRLSILSSGKNNNINIEYLDAFPTSISDISFGYENSDVEYTTASVEFYYTKFKFV